MGYRFRMGRSTLGMYLAVFLLAAMLLAACGGASEVAGPTGAPTPDDAATTAEATEQDTGGAEAEGTPETPADDTEAAAEPVSMTFASDSFGVTELPLFAALDELRADGYEVEYVPVSTSDVQAQGLVQGTFQFVSGSFNGYALAYEAQAPLRMIAQRRTNDWFFYGINEIQGCEDLDGAGVAIHSEVGTTATMTRRYFEEECPGVEPNYLIVPGSENRFAGMLAGEIDATALDTEGAVALMREAPDRFHQIASFSDGDLAQLIAFVQVVNSDWAEENPQAVTDFLEKLLEQHRLVDGDPAYLAELAQRYEEQIGGESDLGDDMFEAYSTVFPTDGGLDPAALDYTVDFFVDAEAMSGEVGWEEFVDRSYLDAALEQLGES